MYLVVVSLGEDVVFIVLNGWCFALGSWVVFECYLCALRCAVTSYECVWSEAGFWECVLSVVTGGLWCGRCCVCAMCAAIRMHEGFCALPLCVSMCLCVLGGSGCLCEGGCCVYGYECRVLWIWYLGWYWLI